MITNLYKYEIAIGYFLLLIVAPLIYITIKSFSAKTKKDYHHLSTMLKLVMLFGMLSMVLYVFVLK
jgi:4-hydroxybenzoate polyprenyltransferase